ncbi:MAG: DNA repair protein RadC [Desulfobacula sp.]|jgi:DNA repair protein RadC|uniref:RadC family protein n=1 Tax=Desulfobacula sp. TaxID=2593537 RepID=UPI001ECBE8C7|nr:DNA repair protein RadC [Desulfobacula sp.]
MKKRLQQLPLEERPREKLLKKGAKSLLDKELLAVLLGKGTPKQDVLALAEKLIPVIDKKGFLLKTEDLIEFEGIGNAKATLILAALEFTRRRVKPEGFKINTPKDIFPHIKHYADRKQEYFLCASINGANEVMNIRVVSIGLVNTTQVHPREVFADPITDRASAIIVAHNHPSGDLAPSKNDISVTQRLINAGNILGIRFLDHVIFNKKTYLSFKEQNLIEELK